METSTPSGSPLRQRMIEDMRMRKLMPRTREAYLRAVSKFAKFLGKSPDTATDEDLRRFQLHLIDQGTSAVHSAVSSLEACTTPALRLGLGCDGLRVRAGILQT